MTEGVVADGGFARRRSFELAAQMSRYERERMGWCNWQELNIGLFYDVRNAPDEQPGKCEPILGKAVLWLLDDPPLG